MLILVLAFIGSASALTEVIITRNQFNDLADELRNISMDINFEDGNLSVDFKQVELLITGTNNRIDLMISQLKNLNTVLESQAEYQKEHYDAWYDNLEKILSPVQQILNAISNAIGLVKDIVSAIQGIFEAFQDTQDAADASIEENVALIAENFAVGMREIVAESLAGSEMTLSALECGAWEGITCEDIPVGISPITCEGMAAEGCQGEGIVIEPIKKKRKIEL